MEENTLPDWPYYTDKVIHEAINDELKLMAKIESNIGLDSTDEEVATARKLNRASKAKIEALDPVFYAERINPK